MRRRRWIESRTWKRPDKNRPGLREQSVWRLRPIAGIRISTKRDYTSLDRLNLPL
ncbi:hypothetical protein Mapa_015207 [Marchantia paleacea]|nr:hypothetical protein Mapa_015207 [Marchantia paleacea]